MDTSRASMLSDSLSFSSYMKAGAKQILLFRIGQISITSFARTANHQDRSPTRPGENPLPERLLTSSPVSIQLWH